ncbi:unnamed protein product [Schistosoma margrebowiei]|uniref:Cadherin domain-containing protein n=1 Tax=Schistosoma margrebowiei TaxID=48269 RepID=A0A3P7ZA35_9TREM|nr:unnamed protein product [Schistosoma margrebowiei]
MFFLENSFTINSTSGIVSLIKQLNSSRNIITKQLLIEASKIGTLYDYSKNLNYKIQILINLTLNFNNDYSIEMFLSNDLIKDPSNLDLIHNDHNQIIIYLQMNQSNSFIQTYTNDTYQFYITDSINLNESILSKMIIYCIQYSSSSSSSSSNHYDNVNPYCELTLKVYDSLLTMNEQDSKDFILKPVQFPCNPNPNHNHNRSNLLCHGYQININPFIEYSLKNQYLLIITPTLISSKYSIKSIKIFLYNIKNQYTNNQFIDKSFNLIQSINKPYYIILNQIGLKSPYCITNISISYKVIKDYKIIKLNQQNENMISHSNKLIYILRHIWLLPKIYWADKNYSNNNNNIEKEMKDRLKLWNGKPFLSLNPYTGILSVSRQLVLMDVGEYILCIDIQDYSQPELFNTTCIIFLNILPTELHQQPINDLPDSISYNSISRSSPYSTTSSLSSSSSVHSPLNPSISINPYNGSNNNVYNLPEQNIKLPIGNNQLMKTNKHLLLSMILITIVIIFIIIIIIMIMIIIYRNKCKSKLMNQYKSNVNIIIDEQNQLLCLTSNHNEEILLKSINSSSSSNNNNNSNHSNHSSSSINMNRNSIYSHNEMNHHYHSTDIIQFNNDLPITTNMYYTNGLHYENMGNLTSSPVGYNMIHGNEPVYNWMNIIEDDQHLSNIHYTFTNHSVVNNFYKNYEDENQQITLTETTSNM